MSFMDEVLVFYPARRGGVLVHSVCMVGFLAMALVGMAAATRSPAGLIVILDLSLAVTAVILLVVMLYRLYALWTANYSLERDGIRLRWGFRSEDIPIDAVLWARVDEDLGVRLPLPFLRWPGAVIGNRHWHGLDGSGRVIEYMAERPHPLILIATSKKVFAISPAEPAAFLTTFQHFREMGSLTPLSEKSVQPGFLFPEVWDDPLARVMILTALGSALFLLAWVGMIIPGRQEISLRISPEVMAVEYVPAVQLMLLPVINIVFFFVNLSLGLFFYQRPEIRSLAYLLWSSSIIVSFLFMGAVFFISQAA